MLKISILSFIIVTLVIFIHGSFVKKHSLDEIIDRYFDVIIICMELITLYMFLGAIFAVLTS